MQHLTDYEVVVGTGKFSLRKVIEEVSPKFPEFQLSILKTEKCNRTNFAQIEVQYNEAKNTAPLLPPSIFDNCVDFNDCCKALYDALLHIEQNLDHYYDSIDFNNLCKPENVYYIVCNYEKNKSWQDSPLCWRLHDLLFVPRLFISGDESGLASLRINQSLYESHFTNLTIDQIKQNTLRLFPVKIESMLDFLDRSGVDIDSDDVKDAYSSADGILTIVAGVYRGITNAASAFFEIDDIANCHWGAKHGLAILPSSTLELLFVPADYCPLPQFCSMVREVNMNMVAEEERLSDNVYVYNFKTKEIECYNEDLQS